MVPKYIFNCPGGEYTFYSPTQEVNTHFGGEYTVYSPAQDVNIHFGGQYTLLS